MYTLAWDDFKYTSKQFGIWRLLFGFYLTFYYLKVLPFTNELYSNVGPFRDLSLNLAPTFFPTSLLTFDTPSQVRVLVVTCAALAFMIMIGFYRKAAAFALWLIVMWLYNRNPYSDSPEYGFVNWLIFALAFIPSGEELSFGPRDKNWQMPKYFYWGAWIVLAAGYFFAGSSKFRSHDPNWMNGTAMYYVLVVDNARLKWYGDLFTNIPLFYFVPFTWGALGLQTLSPVFISFRKLRPWWWIAATATHLGLLFFVNLAQLTFGMIFFHFFLFDYRWFEFLKSRRPTRPFRQRLRQKARFGGGSPIKR